MNVISVFLNKVSSVELHSFFKKDHICTKVILDQFMFNEISHPYQLDKSNSSIRVILNLLFDE